MTKKPKEEQIEISWHEYSDGRFDFGLFPVDKKHKLKVDKKWWMEFVDARFKFEAMQQDLIDKTTP